jgi:hypothetical protein
VAAAGVRSDLLLVLLMVFPVAAPFAAALTTFLAPLLVLGSLIVLDARTVDRNFNLEFFNLFTLPYAFPVLFLAAHADLIDVLRAFSSHQLTRKCVILTPVSALV